MEAVAMAPRSGMGEGTGAEQQRLEGAIRSLARGCDIIAQVQELLPKCFPRSSEATEGLAREISGSVSRALTAFTSSAGGRETQTPAYYPKCRKPRDVSSRWSGGAVKRVSINKRSTTKRSYFRCSQSSLYRCPAVKLVQQTDSDVPTFAVTYIGNHTCQNPLLVDDDGHSNGVTISFASRSLVTSDSKVTTSLPASQLRPSQWLSAETRGEAVESLINNQKFNIPGSFDHTTASPSCSTTTTLTAIFPEEDECKLSGDNSPASSGGLSAGFDNIFEGLSWFSDEEDFLLR